MNVFCCCWCCPSLRFHHFLILSYFRRAIIPRKLVHTGTLFYIIKWCIYGCKYKRCCLLCGARWFFGVRLTLFSAVILCLNKTAQIILFLETRISDAFFFFFVPVSTFWSGCFGEINLFVVCNSFNIQNPRENKFCLLFKYLMPYLINLYAS